MASVLRVAEVNQCQHKMLLLLSPSLLQRLLINPTFCCALNQWVLLVLCVRSMGFDKRAPFQVFTPPFYTARISVELYSKHLNVHKKCSTFHCTTQTFSARDLV